VKSVSPLARTLIAGAVVLALAVYLVVLELGINAGRIHRGVSVGDVDVGGMTQAEAVAFLSGVGRDMRNSSITFTAGDVEFEVSPADLKWWPYAEDMARKAMAVGRNGGVWHSASQRWRAWLSGISIKWRRARPRPVEQQIQEMSFELDALGYELDEQEMVTVLRHAIWQWPRRDTYAIPLDGD
jgi:hypothetical protein